MKTDIEACVICTRPATYQTPHGPVCKGHIDTVNDFLGVPLDDEPSAEQQLRNVAAALRRYTEVTRRWNGRGKSSTYAANADTIASTGRQLAEMVEAYLDENATVAEGRA